VYDDDDLPKLLCPRCAELLGKIELFKEACAQSVDTIRKLIVANLKEEPIEEFVSAETLEPIVKAENEEIDETQDKNVRREQPKRPASQSTTGERPMCALCGQFFINRSGLSAHMKMELRKRAENQVKSERPYFHCSQNGCGQTFKHKKNLETHLKMHNADGVRFIVKNTF
jgi:Zinc finger, C2H2 type